MQQLVLIEIDIFLCTRLAPFYPRRAATCTTDVVWNNDTIILYSNMIELFNEIIKLVNLYVNYSFEDEVKKSCSFSEIDVNQLLQQKNLNQLIF